MSCVIVPIAIKERADIKDVCRDVHDFASQMDCNVKFTFQGVEMEVTIWQLPNEIEKEFYRRKKVQNYMKESVNNVV